MTTTRSNYLFLLPIIVLAFSVVVNKDVLYEFHWLFELQSRNSLKCGNVGHESLIEGKRIVRKMKKTRVLLSKDRCKLKNLHNYT